jgi:hypothetical protein
MTAGFSLLKIITIGNQNHPGLLEIQPAYLDGQFHGGNAYFFGS